MSGVGWAAHVSALDPSSPSGSDQLDQLQVAMRESARLQLPGPGWMPLMEALHERLFRLDPVYRFAQVKEKLGTLRILLEVAPEAEIAATRVVRETEARSAATCERCGGTGWLRTDRRWFLTLCDPCDRVLPPGAPRRPGG